MAEPALCNFGHWHRTSKEARQCNRTHNPVIAHVRAREVDCAVRAGIPGHLARWKVWRFIPSAINPQSLWRIQKAWREQHR